MENSARLPLVGIGRGLMANERQYIRTLEAITVSIMIADKWVNFNMRSCRWRKSVQGGGAGHPVQH